MVALLIPVALATDQDGSGMETQSLHFSCHHCGKRVEHCSGGPRCEVLEGWLTVSRWGGRGVVSHYNFCSLSCLRIWADAHITRIPEVFLKSFEEDGHEDA